MERKGLYIIISILVVALAVGTFIAVKNTEPVTGALSLTQEETKSGSIGDRFSRRFAVEGGYDIPERDLKSTKYVKNENYLMTPGQYTVSSEGLQTTLVSVKSLNQVCRNGSITYKFVGLFIFDNKARTRTALRGAQNDLSAHDLTSHYKTVKLVYTIMNDSDQAIVTGGISTVTYQNGQIVSELNGLQNNLLLSRNGILTGQMIDATTTVLLPKSVKTNHLGDITVQFASIYRAHLNEKLENVSSKVLIKN